MTISQTDFTKFPSISGNNGYSMKCEQVRLKGEPAHASYAVCQHTILAYKENRLPPGSFVDCAVAIAEGRCQAVRMMVEEVKAGQSLYFVDMQALIKDVSDRNAAYSKPKHHPRPATSLLPASRKASTIKSGSITPITDVYAELIKEESA
jgi:hypothetical protein